MPKMICELSNFNFKLFDALHNNLKQNRIKFFSLSELGDAPKNQIAFYKLIREVILDDPGFDGEFETEAEFLKNLWPLYWQRKHGTILAIKNNNWLGLSSISKEESVEYPEVFWIQGFTGVVRAARGQGLGTALKAMALGYAQKITPTGIVQTEPDDNNLASLALNKKFGFDVL